MYPYKIDLHIHTALSPCADPEMTPPKIIHAARAKGLNMIAVTDHNTAENAAAVIEAARGSGIIVIPGMEVQTREEVHLVCLFPTLEACLAWQASVYESLPTLDNVPQLFGNQPIMDSLGKTMRELTRLLLVSSKMSVDETAAKAAELGGICIPAHVDRPSFSLLGVLGFIPEGLAIKALEISSLVSADEAVLRYPSLAGCQLISSSDAHFLKDIGHNPSILRTDKPPVFDLLKTSLEPVSERKVIPRMKDLSMHIIDVIQNSLEAGADKIRLEITENTAEDKLTIKISDNGRGMDPDTLAQVIDPFFTTRQTRRIGLGLPLLKAAAERCDGQLKLNSAPGEGTEITAVFRHTHIDRAPLGNIIDTLVNLIAGNPELNFFFSHQIEDRTVTFDADELRNQLEDIPLSNPAVLNWIKNYLVETYNDH